MDKDYKQVTNEFLQSHRYLTLATVSAANQPYAATLAFAAKDATVYFVTDPETQKVVNIKANNKVAYTVDEEEIKDWNEIQGIQMIGTASVVTDPQEIELAHELLIEKFPEFANMPHDNSMVFVKVEPLRGRFHDCTVSFGFSVDLHY